MVFRPFAAARERRRSPLPGELILLSLLRFTGQTTCFFPRWEGNNGPEQTDLIAASNLIKATPPDSVGRFVYVTSAGVERQGSMPWLILNLFGVLKFKRQSEMILEASSLNWTIFRPGRLTDGPYTSYDLNTVRMERV